MKHFTIGLLFILISLGCSAQKQYKQLRSYIKSGSDLDKALQLVDTCRADSALCDDPELYNLAAQVEKKRYEAQNTKLYLKQSYDTTTFFSAIYGIFQNSMLWDEKECIPDSKGRVRPRSRSKIHRELTKHYANLFAGGLHYLKKQNWTEAHKFFALYLSLDTIPIFAPDSLNITDPRRPRAAFHALRCSFESEDFAAVPQYADLAEKDTANLSFTLQYQAIAARRLGKTDEMAAVLQRGVELVPDNHYFFSNLIDYYNSLPDYETSLALCRAQIEADSTIMLYHFAEGVVLFSLRDWDGCVEAMQTVQQNDTSFAEADFYIASCYYNRACEIEEGIDPELSAQEFMEKRTQVQQLYTQAMPFMEAYRCSSPTDKERWATPLYKIYLALNEAEKFREIEALIGDN